MKIAIMEIQYVDSIVPQYKRKTSFPLEEDVIMFISEPSPFHYKNYVVTT